MSHPSAPQDAPGPASALAEKLFQEAFHHSPIMQSVVRVADGCIVEVNDTFLRQLGLRREETVGREARELNFWADAEQLAQYRALLQEQGSIRNCEVVLRARDGSTFTVLLSSHTAELGGVQHYVSAAVDITSRKQTEAELHQAHERLRQSEERFSKVFHANPAMVALTRLSDHRLVSVNRAFCRLTGYAEHELLGRTTTELDLYARPEAREAFFESIRARGCVRDYEHLLRTRDSQTRTLLISAEVVEVDDAPHLLVVGVDITARTDVEADLRESERRLREKEALFATAFRSSPVQMTIARLSDARFVEVNPAFLRLIGRPPEEILGRNTREIDIWVSMEAREDFHVRLRREGVLRDVPCAIRGASGDVRQVYISAEIIEINREPHLITFGLDMTEQLRAERGLRQSEAKARALYESIGAAVVVHDEQGFVQANPAALRLFGASNPEELLGLQPEDNSAPFQANGESSREAALRYRRQAIAEGSAHFEWLGRKLDGADVLLDVTLTAFEFEGRPAVQAVMTDLSERRRAEAELQNALARERELSQLKSDFVSLVSHEFRTPLEIIMSSVDNLQRYHDRLPPEKRDQLLRTINKSVRRMSGMMEEVLVLGRLETDRVTFQPTECDFPALCRRICEEIESATNRPDGIELRLEGEFAHALGDESVLRHILANLLSNAVKYSPVDRTVEFHVRREGDEAICRIADRGCGIPRADQKRLFEAFHRGSNVRHIPGTGLGLLIVQRCVGLHRGELTFESTEGEGTTFTVALPLFPEIPDDPNPT